MQSYAALQDGEQEESGVLIHVVESSRSRWNHIEDLDSFFARMYRYHQRHGFYCMMLQEALELVQFVFVVSFTTFLVHGIDYPLLFGDKPPPDGKLKIPDIILSWDEFHSSFGFYTYLLLVTAAFVWALRLLRGIYNTFHFWDIKQFYNCALGIDDSQLDNLTWHEVQTKVLQVQLEQQMCIHKKELSELDIYHRILRQENYLIALSNKRLVPPTLKIPLLGECCYWTRGLRYNMKLLLFWGPWAPFQNPWHLREEYRKANMRHDLAKELGCFILWLALANMLLAPLVLLWQILYTFFSYAEVIKREPGSLGVRAWSLYGRLYLRHFNELEHELQARLNRAHRPATRYLSAHSAPMAAIVARNLSFMGGAIVAAMVSLLIFDNDVFNVDHWLTVISSIGVFLAICRGLIPDETLAWCPETLLSNVLAHTHYLPLYWKGQAHTKKVRAEFQQLFQYRIAGLIEELISPVMTPYILWRHIYPRALDIVDFFRNFTVSVVGVGDVCSFAQMDVRKHGNPEWQGNNIPTSNNQYTQAEDGKTELSLVHFTLTNPSWRPPKEAQEFVQMVERESVVANPQSSGDFMLHANLSDSLSYGAMSRREGPGSTNANNMSVSTLYLYDRHYRQVGHRYHRPVEETTPLLSSQ